MSDSHIDLYLEGEERFDRFGSFIYALFARRGLRPLHEFALREVVDEALRTKPKRILDLGAGPGLLTCRLAQRLPEVEVYGVDPSPHMLRQAEKIAVKMGVDNVHFKLGSSRVLPDLSFDIIYSVLSFHHWAKQAQALDQVYTHLSGGKFMVFEYNKDRLPFYYFPARGHAMRVKTFEELKQHSRFSRLEVKEEGRLLLAIYVKEEEVGGERCGQMSGKPIVE
jgi:ubiquinone/menaquinone biosynthesis C-methylase UbiE